MTFMPSSASGAPGDAYLHSMMRLNFPVKNKKAGERILRPDLFKELAATYSRGSYTTTTIGKTVFDGRVRNGNGSDHSFMATKIIAARDREEPAAPTPVTAKL